jgi:CheY-like chemotaxis protein
LIVEDIPAVRLSLKIVLQGDGHRITCAENGTHGIDLLKTEAFDLVVTDIWMPGANGADVIREGKARSPGTRFLAITGGNPNNNGPQDALCPQEFGADRVLLKPFEKAELLGAVSRVLEGVA